MAQAGAKNFPRRSFLLITLLLSVLSLANCFGGSLPVRLVQLVPSSGATLAVGNLNAPYTTTFECLDEIREPLSSGCDVTVGSQGSLPPGLSVAGLITPDNLNDPCSNIGTCFQISGTPTATGTFSFDLVAHSSEGPGEEVNYIGSYTITINAGLTIKKTHNGSGFTQGQMGQYTLTVSNAATALATTGAVMVTETPPSGETFISMSGTGWNCPGAGGAMTCDRSDSLTPGVSYPPIMVTVNVAANAASPQVNTATVTNGGSSASDSDSTPISSSSVVVMLTVNPGSATAPAGKAVQFTAQAKRQDGTTFDVTAQANWASSDNSVAMVSQGAAMGIKANAQPIMIQATYQGQTGQASFTVTPAALVSINVEPTPASVAVGATIPFAADGIFTDGSQQNITTSVIWSSSNPAIATVSNTSGEQGVATGVAPSSQPVHIVATDQATSISGFAQLTVTGTSFVQSALLIPGNVVAVDDAGDTIVTAFGTDTFVFVFSNGSWTQVTQLSNPDGSVQSVAISGDGNTIAIGSCGNAVCKGHAFVYVKPAGGWNVSATTPTAMLSASDAFPAGGDRIGFSVAIARGPTANGNVVAVGAPDELTMGTGAGKVYVFIEPAGGWQSKNQDATLTVNGSQNLGAAVSIDSTGDSIAAGAANGLSTTVGTGYVFLEPPGGWANGAAAVATLTPSDGIGGGLGHSIAISGQGNTVVAGAPINPASGNTSGPGAAYVFRAHGGWMSEHEDAKLIASDGHNGDFFGDSVSITGFGDTVVVGAPSHGATKPALGAVYAFTLPGGAPPSQTQEVFPSAANGVTPSSFFGGSVAISANSSTLAAVGFATTTSGSGTVVFVFTF